MIHNLTVSKKMPVDAQMQSYLDGPQFQKDKAMLQQRVTDIDSGKTTLISHDEMWNKKPNIQITLNMTLIYEPQFYVNLLSFPLS